MSTLILEIQPYISLSLLAIVSHVFPMLRQTNTHICYYTLDLKETS